MGAPLTYEWNGEAMVPLPRFHNRANAEFVVGEEYPLAIEEGRSQRSHNHFFAELATAWANLPDHMAERFPTAEHLRKFALIRTGYSDQRTLACSSRAEALRVLAFVKPLDEFAIVTVQEATVTVFTAQSQSKRAMGAKEFQESKDKVLAYVSQLIGVDVSDLKRSVMEAAA